MRTVTVSTKNGDKSVQTDLNLYQAYIALADSTNNFAQSLRESYRDYGDKISAGRASWMIVIAQEELDRRNRPTAQVDLGNMSGIAELFRKARQRLLHPKIRLVTKSGQDVALSLRRDGGINVTNGRKYGASDNRYYGRILESGIFDTRNPNAEVVELLQRFAADPAGVAAEYGKLVGACCFCSIRLTDERSVFVGYGERCSEVYGLPWGARPEQGTLSGVLPDDHPDYGK